MACFDVALSILGGYVVTDVIMALVLHQKNRSLFDQLLTFFKSPEVLLPLVVGTIAGVVIWYVLGELDD